MTFGTIKNPELGGRIDLLIDGRTVDGQKVNILDELVEGGQLMLIHLPSRRGLHLAPAGTKMRDSVTFFAPTGNPTSSAPSVPRARRQPSCHPIPAPVVC